MYLPRALRALKEQIYVFVYIYIYPTYIYIYIYISCQQQRDGCSWVRGGGAARIVKYIFFCISVYWIFYFRHTLM